MKTGMVRRIDKLGRVVVPREIMRVLNIKVGDPLEISLDGNKVCFELYVSTEGYENMVNRLIALLKEDYCIGQNSEKVIAALSEASKLLKETEPK